MHFQAKNPYSPYQWSGILIIGLRAMPAVLLKSAVCMNRLALKRRRPWLSKLDRVCATVVSAHLTLTIDS